MLLFSHFVIINICINSRSLSFLKVFLHTYLPLLWYYLTGLSKFLPFLMVPFPLYTRLPHPCRPIRDYLYPSWSWLHSNESMWNEELAKLSFVRSRPFISLQLPLIPQWLTLFVLSFSESDFRLQRKSSRPSASKRREPQEHDRVGRAQLSPGGSPVPRPRHGPHRARSAEVLLQGNSETSRNPAPAAIATITNCVR